MTTKIIMDTDPGIDDAAALTMAINNPAIDLKLVTAVAGNVTVDKTTANALKIVNFFGKGDQIPVAAGAAEPLIKPFEDAALEWKGMILGTTMVTQLLRQLFRPFMMQSWLKMK